MALSVTRSSAPVGPPRRYLRPPVPLHFPESESVPESDTHLELRMLLYESVRLALGDQGLVSSEQFVYFDPTDPEALRCDALGLYWCVREDSRLGRTLRLARDPAGTDLLPTPAEAERARAEVERARAEAAELRLTELEARLRDRTARDP